MNAQKGCLPLAATAADVRSALQSIWERGQYAKHSTVPSNAVIEDYLLVVFSLQAGWYVSKIF